MPAVHPFLLERPRSVDEAVEILAEHGDEARVLAGGQSLTPLLTLGFSAPSVVVSLDRCRDLDVVERRADGLHIGAMVTTARLEADPAVAERVPLVATAAGQVGSPHVRNFGTVVGNVCHGDPGSDLIPALLCHRTSLRLSSPTGHRSVPLDGFVTGPFMTTIEPGELAVEIVVEPDWPDGDRRFGYRKLVKRAGDLAIAISAVRLAVDGATISDARVVVGGATATAVRLRHLESQLVDGPLDGAVERALGADPAAECADQLMPHAGAPLDYLQRMLPRFVAAAIGDAIERGAVDG